MDRFTPGITSSKLLRNNMHHSSTSKSIIIFVIITSNVALLKYQYHLLYQPLFLSFSCVSCCFMSVYPTTVFLRGHNENNVTQLFVLSLHSHLMENFFTTIFNFNEFIFVHVVNITFICAGEICLLTYLLSNFFSVLFRDLNQCK